MIHRNCTAIATEMRYCEAMDVMMRSFRVVMINTIGKWSWVRAIGRSCRLWRLDTPPPQTKILPMPMLHTKYMSSLCLKTNLSPVFFSSSLTAPVSLSLLTEKQKLYD